MDDLEKALRLFHQCSKLPDLIDWELFYKLKAGKSRKSTRQSLTHFRECAGEEEEPAILLLLH